MTMFPGIDPSGLVTPQTICYAVVILIRTAENWKASHGGALPRTSKEHSEFKDAIKNMKLKADGVPIQVRGCYYFCVKTIKGSNIEDTSW